MSSDELFEEDDQSRGEFDGAHMGYPGMMRGQGMGLGMMDPGSMPGGMMPPARQPDTWAGWRSGGSSEQR